MTEYGDHPALEGHPIDEEYIEPDRKRADCRISDRTEKDDELDRSAPTAQAADVSADKSDMSHHFDHGAGSGAASGIDDAIDKDAVQEHDGRAETRTGFDPRESKDPEKWRRLNVLNDDHRHPDRKQQNRDADKRRYADTFCGHLGMSRYQRERVKAITRSINMKHMAYYGSDEVILAIVSLVANEDGWFIRDEQTYKDLIRDVGSSMHRIKRIRQLVREKSDLM